MDLRISASNKRVFLPASAKLLASSADIVLFPSLSHALVITITLISAPQNKIFVRSVLKFSLVR